MSMRNFCKTGGRARESFYGQFLKAKRKQGAICEFFVQLFRVIAVSQKIINFDMRPCMAPVHTPTYRPIHTHTFGFIPNQAPTMLLVESVT